MREVCADAEGKAFGGATLEDPERYCVVLGCDSVEVCAVLFVFEGVGQLLTDETAERRAERCGCADDARVEPAHRARPPACVVEADG